MSSLFALILFGLVPSCIACCLSGSLIAHAANHFNNLRYPAGKIILAISLLVAVSVIAVIYSIVNLK